MGQFQASVDDAALIKHWPADFQPSRPIIRWWAALVTDYTIDNPDSNPLPFAFGTHGYFRIPLGGERRRLPRDRPRRYGLAAGRAVAHRPRQPSRTWLPSWPEWRRAT